MKCPKCKKEMLNKPLKYAIAKGLVGICRDEDISKCVYDKMIEETEFAICKECRFVMLPPKQ